MKIFQGEKTFIKSWCENPESGAIDQAKHLASLPFVHKHIALMPDTHEGYGMPIGGVMATDGVVIPNAVGVDIGCGMCAIKTPLTEIDTETLKKIMGEIRKQIPTGFSKHKQAQDLRLKPEFSSEIVKLGRNAIVLQEYDNSLKSLGTLGGGNHFIEIQKGDDGHIWVMIHSGSRNLGLKVATHYNKLAKELNKKYSSSIPPSWDLAFLPIDSKEGEAYLSEMQYCVDFALANRKLMMERVINIIHEYTDIQWFDPIINIAHNYAALEEHFGKVVMVHRKGATQSYKDQIGIIPGSQGSASYIVKGLGNPDSFKSCSHGAGRKMSRSKARTELSLDAEIEALAALGVIHAVRNQKDLDEAPGSYKDIDVVMEEQKDLVEVVTKLTPLAVIKG